MQSGAAPSRRWPSNAMRPVRGVSSPEMARGSVVLPAPLAHPAVEDADAVDLEQAQARVPGRLT
jgi:hypothetical protein